MLLLTLRDEELLPEDAFEVPADEELCEPPPMDELLFELPTDELLFDDDEVFPPEPVDVVFEPFEVELFVDGLLVMLFDRPLGLDVVWRDEPVLVVLYSLSEPL